MPNMFYELIFKSVISQHGSKTVLGEYQVYDPSTKVVVVDSAGPDGWGENLITVGQTPDAFMQFPLEDST